MTVAKYRILPADIGEERVRTRAPKSGGEDRIGSSAVILIFFFVAA